MFIPKGKMYFAEDDALLFVDLLGALLLHQEGIVMVASRHHGERLGGMSLSCFRISEIKSWMKS